MFKSFSNECKVYLISLIFISLSIGDFKVCNLHFGFERKCLLQLNLLPDKLQPVCHPSRYVLLIYICQQQARQPHWKIPSHDRGCFCNMCLFMSHVRERSLLLIEAAAAIGLHSWAISERPSPETNFPDGSVKFQRPPNQSRGTAWVSKPPQTDVHISH